MDPRWNLRQVFSLRKAQSLSSRPNSERHVVARLLEWRGQRGLADTSGFLWPVRGNFAQALGIGEHRLQWVSSDGQLWCHIQESTGFHPHPSSTGFQEPQVGWYPEGGGHDPKQTLFFQTPLAQRTENLHLRSVLAKRCQDFFMERGFLDVLVPILVPSGGFDLHNHAFRTQYIDAQGTSHPMELPTSPEFALKKVMAQGATKVFHLSQSFRNCGELGPWHEPQFTMLEWYRSGAPLVQIEADTVAFLRALAEAVGKVLPPIETYTVEELLQGQLGVGLRELQDPQRLYPLACQVSGRQLPKEESWEVLFSHLSMGSLEPYLATRGICFVYDFPWQLGSLAQREDLVAKRFEVYWQGVEIANAYLELRDDEELLGRIAMAQQIRAVADDSEFRFAMEIGLPPSVGIAVGFDRTVALLLGFDRIAELRPYPLLHRDLGR